MEIHKTIKVFLASSAELMQERKEFGNLIRSLDKKYLKRGIHVDLFMWEDLDPCYNNVRKQDEYNAKIRESHIFVCLFYTRAGQYTLEELDVAKAENLHKNEPKIMIFCRNLKDCDVEMPDLIELKRQLNDEWHYFWGNFPNTDKLHLDFVMFLLDQEGDIDKVRIEDGNVLFDNLRIACMDNLPFASKNEGYKEMKQRLVSLSLEIETLSNAMQGVPSLRNLHQQKLNEYYDLKDKFVKHQQALLDTAKRISEMQLKNVSNELNRAKREFYDNGRVEAANVILDGIEREAERHLEQLDCNRALVHQDIEALLLKVKTLMLDINLSIEERKQQTRITYKKADEWAERSTFPKKDYSRLLYDYASFLYDYAFYEEALEIIQKQISLTSEKAMSYNIKGNILYSLDMYQEALDIFNEALEILKKNQYPDELLIADIYNNIGRVLNRMGEFDKAIEQSQNALNSCGSEDGKRMSNSAKSFGNIAEGLWPQGSYRNALENYKRALEIEKRLFGEDSKQVAITYRHIGDVYRGLSDNSKAMDNYKKALSILENKLGSRHPETALTYGCIGVSLMDLHKYKESMDITQKGLKIREDIFGVDNTNTAESYFWLGELYSKHSELQNFDYALKYYNKAKDIRIKIFGVSHYETLNVEYSIAELYINQGKYSDAIAHFQKYIDNLEAQKSYKPKDIVNAYYYFGMIYASTGDYDDAINYLEKAISISTVEDYSLGSIHTYLASLYKIKSNLLNSINHSVIALAIMKKINGDESHEVAYMYSTIGKIYEEVKDYDHALVYFKIALDIQERLIDTEDFGVASIYYNIGQILDKLGDYPKALLYYNKALVWVSEHEISDISIADVYNVIGIVYYNQGDYSHALEYFHKAVDRKDESSDTGTIYYNLGNTYFAQSDFTQALDYYLKAKPIREKDLGKNHPDVVSLYRDIGLVYCQMENSSKALAYLDDLLKVLKDHEQNLDSSDSSFATDYEAIGSLYCSLGDYGNAVCFYYKCLVLLEKTNGSMSVEAAQAYMNYGIVCYYRCEFGTSLEYFNKALDIFKKRLKPTALDTRNAQEWIDVVKASTGNIISSYK